MKNLFKKFITRALIWESRLVLRRYKPKIVAVTGSVGKTTTKDAIYFALTSKYYVRRSEKSYNSEIGIPLTILGCPNAWHSPVGWFRNLWKGLRLIAFRSVYPGWLVLEVGADRPGDIKMLSSWIHADIVVFTEFAKVPVHVEFFNNDPEVLFKEKSYLILGMKEDGHLVLNADNDKVKSLQDLRRAGSLTMIGTEGNREAGIVAEHAGIEYESRGDLMVPKGILFKLRHGNSSIPVSIRGVLGKQHIYPALFAFAVALGEGMNLIQIAESLETYAPPRGRMNIVEGIKESIIIDDTYNSSPVAVEEALTVLKEVRASGRKIAVLGDMLELGRHSAEAHHSIGRLIAGNIEILATVGIRAREIAEVALHNGMSEKNVFQFESAKEAGLFMQNLIQKGDVILVKGSQGVRCEKVVQEIMAHPELRDSLLVRQETEWKRK